MTTETTAQTTVNIAARAAHSKGATAPVALDVSERFALADSFLIVSGSVERNVQAISDGIEEELLEVGVKAIRREGRESGRWVLLDFGDLIVHIFHEEDRQYYDLERLWRDCPPIPLELPQVPRVG